MAEGDETGYLFLMLAREISEADPDESDPADLVDDEAALTEYREKGGISHEAMSRWLLSWGTANELSPPQIGD